MKKFILLLFFFPIVNFAVLYVLYASLFSIYDTQTTHSINKGELDISEIDKDLQKYEYVEYVETFEENGKLYQYSLNNEYYIRGLDLP